MDDLATYSKHLVNFGPVTAKFKKGKDVQTLVDQQFCLHGATAIDFVGISSLLSFPKRIEYCHADFQKSSPDDQAIQRVKIW